MHAATRCSVVLVGVAASACTLDAEGKGSRASCDDCAATSGSTAGGGGPPPSGVVPDDWYDAAWRRRREILVAHDRVTATLASFPLLVIVDDPATLAALHPDASDVLVTAGDGETQLSHEVERFDPRSELVVWIGVPALSADEDTRLFLYYDNATPTPTEDPSGVWDPTTVGVWHLGEDVVDGATGVMHVDSTAHGRHGAQNGNAGVSGRIGRAQAFDGGGDHIDLSQPAGVVLGDADCTVSAWIRTTSAADMGILLKSKGVVHEPGDKLFGVNHTRSMLGIDHGWVTYLAGTTNVIDGDWHHVVWTQQKDVAGNDELWTLYVDGAAQGSKPATTMPDVADHTLRIGWHADQSYFSNPFAGTIDEVTISSAARTPAWIAATFENQRSPSTFAVVGPEQALR